MKSEHDQTLDHKVSECNLAQSIVGNKIVFYPGACQLGEGPEATEGRLPAQDQEEDQEVFNQARNGGAQEG